MHTLQIIVIAVRKIIRLPIAIIPCAPIDADNPGPVPIVVAAIVILVVMASIVISVIPSTVIVSRSWRGNKADNTEHHSKHYRTKIFHKSPETTTRSLFSCRAMFFAALLLLQDRLPGRIGRVGDTPVDIRLPDFPVLTVEYRLRSARAVL